MAFAHSSNFVMTFATWPHESGTSGTVQPLAQDTFGRFVVKRIKKSEDKQALGGGWKSTHTVHHKSPQWQARTVALTLETPVTSLQHPLSFCVLVPACVPSCSGIISVFDSVVLELIPLTIRALHSHSIYDLDIHHIYDSYSCHSASYIHMIFLNMIFILYSIHDIHVIFMRMIHRRHSLFFEPPTCRVRWLPKRCDC